MKRCKSYVESSLLLCLTVSAFIFCYNCGSRGFFPLDQSIVYDGAWRIIQGQIPFKDFIAPIGPISFLYQAEIFCIFGISYKSYLIGAALFNALACLLTYLIIKKLYPDNPVFSFGGALLSGIWFYSQMGTTYPDQTSMFFCLLSLFLLIYSDKHSTYRIKLLNQSTLFFASGFIWGLAFLSKQNSATFFLPLLFAVPVFRNFRDFKNPLIISSGILTCFLLFVSWLFIYSDPNLFMKYFFIIPIKEGIRRFQGNSINFKHRFTFIIIALNTIAGVFAIISLVLYFFSQNPRISYLRSLLRIPENGTQKFRIHPAILQSVIVLYMIIYSFVLIKTTNNNAVNTWAFLGIIIGIGFSCADRIFSNINSSFRIGVIVVTIISILLLSVSGIKSAWNRQVHDFMTSVEYKPFLYPPSMTSLKWCSLTPAGRLSPGRYIAIRDFEVSFLLRYLIKTDANFFIFSDFTALYGFIGKTSPQPLLWFHKGLTYPREYDRNLDAMIVDSLRKNKIDTIIIERISWLGSYKINDFPLLKEYIINGFSKVGNIGVFIIYRKKHNSSHSQNAKFTPNS